MRVLKFGGTSVANAERFLRVADILESNARQGQVATVLSAPAKITNHLVAMIEKTIGGQDALTNIADAERIFAELLQGLANAQPGFPLADLKAAGCDCTGKPAEVQIRSVDILNRKSKRGNFLIFRC